MQREEKRFLYDVVANSRNSIDVDKFDYIERDCRNCGIQTGYSYERFVSCSPAPTRFFITPCQRGFQRL